MEYQQQNQDQDRRCWCSRLRLCCSWINKEQIKCNVAQFLCLPMDKGFAACHHQRSQHLLNKQSWQTPFCESWRAFHINFPITSGYGFFLHLHLFHGAPKQLQSCFRWQSGSMPNEMASVHNTKRVWPPALRLKSIYTGSPKASTQWEHQQQGRWATTTSDATRTAVSTV